MKSVLIQLSKLSKTFYRKYQTEIKDLIVFGSFMRGKLEPQDIDVLIIFKKKVDKDIEYEFKKLLLPTLKNVSLISKTEETYQEPSFDAREGILFEGYSLIKQGLIAAEFGFISLGLFFYSTKEMSNLNKTKFYYALNGRKPAKGIVEKLKGIKLSDNLIAFPLDKIEPAKAFFNFWKMEYRYVPTLIPQRLGRKEIIGTGRK
ncbi:MAG: nucleotidyltransferase domain-containing protein [Nanoarchaeota archaeon]